MAKRKAREHEDLHSKMAQRLRNIAKDLEYSSKVCVTQDNADKGNKQVSAKRCPYEKYGYSGAAHSLHTS